MRRADAPTIHPVILSGGAGTRLWPLSREMFPKQLQKLVSDQTLLQETARRVGHLAAPIAVCNHEHRFIVGEQLRQAGIEPRAIVIEPIGRNTAPAAAIAALMLADEPDALMLVLPSDHSVRDAAAFARALDAAAPLARTGRLVTFGILPTAAATGYGYIKRGAAAEGGFLVDSFVEKPDSATAEAYLRSDDYYWNSGIFLFPARLYLDELRRHHAAVEQGCRMALEAGKRDLFFFRLDAAAFAAVPAISIDYAVMEKTAQAAVVPVDMGWSDVGSWSALWAETAQDEAGNALVGDVTALDCENSYIRSDDGMVAAIGLRDVVIVATRDAVLVADKSRDQDVKRIVEDLKARGRPEAAQHPLTWRPWGCFHTIDRGERFHVKQIMVKPGERLSLQKHALRSEHWVVVSGTATVVCGEREFPLKENESTYIPAGTVHRLSNAGDQPLLLIEVQSGDYLGEDDIVRLDDVYGR